MRQLADLMVEPVVRAALLEDLGRSGDITTDAIVDAGHRSTVALVARQRGTVAGLSCARLAWQLLSPEVRMEIALTDGSAVRPGDVLATASGPTRALLSGERVGLNLLGHLSGVATQTRRIVDAVAHTAVRVVDTRKTTPGLRALEKYAVRCGGGHNHRFGLDDAVLIKDNHVAVAGSVTAAVAAVRAEVGHLVKVEVEVDTLSQVTEALALPVDAILLDNMSLDDLSRAVDLVAGRVTLEASGTITVETAADVAATGVDVISVGWLTHSAPSLDIGLDHVG